MGLSYLKNLEKSVSHLSLQDIVIRRSRLQRSKVGGKKRACDENKKERGSEKHKLKKIKMHMRLTRRQ